MTLPERISLPMVRIPAVFSFSSIGSNPVMFLSAATCYDPGIRVEGLASQEVEGIRQALVGTGEDRGVELGIESALGFTKGHE